MAHELNMREPKKVLDRLEQGADIIRRMQGTIQTVAEISKMDLAIGGVDKGFVALEQIQPHMEDALQVFQDIKEKVEQNVHTFQRNNENFEF